MMDSLLWLTPLLVLGVLALLGFVGCDRVFDVVRGTVGSPEFDPPAGFYDSPQNVSLVFSGAKIYFTLDGTPATTSSTLYTDPIPVSTMATINAIAEVDGDTGPNAEASYGIGVITLTQAPAETSQDAGTNTNQIVTPAFNANAGDLVMVWFGTTVR